jgi:predicted nucleic acid-binding protein
MLIEDILVDSSFLIALYDRNSKSYGAAKETARINRGRYLVPQVVLTEVIYFLKRETGVQGALQFLEEFNASQPYLQDVTVTDLQRVKEIMQQYASSRLDFVDSCIMALSERLAITRVCTLDRRDFTIFRPKHVTTLELLP